MAYSTFLPNVLVFIVLNSFALMAETIKKSGKSLGHFLALVSAVAFFGMLFSGSSFELSELFAISGTKLLLAKIVAALNIGMILMNGAKTHSSVRSSLLINFMFMGSIFLLGAKELVTFYVALETIALVGYSLVALSKDHFSKEASIKYLIQGSIISVVFLLGVALFLGATGSLNLEHVNVQNHELYVMSLTIFIIVAAFKLGAFPFHAWMADVYSNVTDGNLATNFFVSKIIVGFKFIVLLQALIVNADPHYQTILVKIVQIIAVTSAFYGNIIAVVQKQFKRIIAYSSLAHTGYMFMMISLNPDEGIERQLIAFLVLYSMTATGVLLALNKFSQENYFRDDSKVLLGGFYRNPFLASVLLFFVLSLAGIPLTSGFALKYMMFTSFFREGFTLESVSILISSIIGLSYYIKFVSDLFVDTEKNKFELKAPVLGMVQTIIFVCILVVGIAPGLFFEMK